MSSPFAATWISGVVAFTCTLGFCYAQLPAFPGAEGEGRYVTGGRGGDVYHVTNLNDAGAGSLRFGVDSANGPRTIVFDVSGAIRLESTLRVGKPNITIAGQTAPGKGISIYHFGVNIQQPNVIVRHLRVRPGDARKGPRDEQGFSGDAISIGSSNVIVDHVSASWALDENVSVAGAGNTGVTVQYSIISEGLDQTGLWHDQRNSDYDPGGTGHHSHGSLIKPTSGDGVVTYHHNLWSNNWNRNPAVGTYATDQTLKVDLRNNVLYNNRSGGYSSGESARVDMNYVANYIISGPATSGSFDPFKARAANKMFIYRADNKFDGNRNGVLDGSGDQQHIVTGDCTELGAPVAMADVTTDDVAAAFDQVTANAGAFPWNRDPVDIRLISQVTDQLGGPIIDSQEEVGGYPEIPVVKRPANFDSDADGIPDAFELQHGLNPNDPEDRSGTNLSPAGYANLEFYLNAVTTGVHHADIKEKHVPCHRGALSGCRHRVVVSTDIGGTDPDDLQSMVHLLLYADVLDIEGLISSPYGPGRATDILRVIDCYAADYPQLQSYADAYPTADALRALTKQGAIEVAPYSGVRRSTEGSEWLVACARRDDPRPLHVLVWGGLEDLAQALRDAADILPKLRVYWIGGPNKKWSHNAYQYVVEHHPELWMIEANSTYRGWFVGGQQTGEWSNAGFVAKHVADHGALGRFFSQQLGGVIKMGDSPSVGWLLAGTPKDPSQPGWGGRFARAWERPFVQLERMPTPMDRMEVFGVLEMALKLGDDLPAKPQAVLVVENQELPGHSKGDGTMRFRFCPKAAKRYEFSVRSNVAALNGMTGGITAVPPAPEVTRRHAAGLANWWTDHPAPEYTEDGHFGAKTVSRWRREFLTNFAARMDRCAGTE